MCRSDQPDEPASPLVKRVGDVAAPGPRWLTRELRNGNAHLGVTNVNSKAGNGRQRAAPRRAGPRGGRCSLIAGERKLKRERTR